MTARYNPIMRYLKRIAARLAPAIALPVAHAQAPEPTAPLYQVEIIVFAHNDGNPGDEDFHHGSDELPAGPALRRLRLPSPELDSLFDVGLPAGGAAALGEDAGALPAAAAAEAAATAPGEQPAAAPPADGLEVLQAFADSGANGALVAAREPLPAGFRTLTAEELELGDVRRSLAGIGSRPYRVLAHTGWIQRGLDEANAVPLDLKQLGITNPVGKIELHVGRYFYVALDFDYIRGSGTFWTAPVGTALAPFEYAERISIHTERFGIRRDRLDYIDHPLLGVLVQIRLAPEPEPTESRPSGPPG
jgi:hypothetical protein